MTQFRVALYVFTCTTDSASRQSNNLPKNARLIRVAASTRRGLMPRSSNSANCRRRKYLWAWLKRHALANFCPDTLDELKQTARAKLKSGQRRRAIIASCWAQAELF